jgi:hypothetical protein
VFINQQELAKLEKLCSDLNENLNILNSAVNNDNNELQVCDLGNFINETCNISNEAREIFYNTIF